MKIGILTFHNADNYGAVLQCYALQEYLKTLYPNDIVNVIDYRSPKIENEYKIISLRRTLFQNIIQFLYVPRNFLKRERFRKFRKLYLNIGTADFSSYDIIYYGSDQIWNTKLTGGDFVYFGKDFSGKKIAYAASDGGELEFTDEVISALNDFSEISCRENSLATRLLQNHITVPIKTASDPVFLLSKEHWLRLSEKPTKTGYILAYKIAPRSDFDEQAELLSSKLGKSVVKIVSAKSIRKTFYKKQLFAQGVSPNKFLGYIAYSDYVLTTSFHATAFSIIFEKTFTVLSFQKRNERIKELLSYFSLESCFKPCVEERNKKNVLFLSRHAPIPSTGGIERVVYTLKNFLNMNGKYTIYSASFGKEEQIEKHFYLPNENFSKNLQELILRLNIGILVCHINVDINIVKEVSKIKCKNISVYYYHHHAIVAKPSDCLSFAYWSAKKAKGLVKAIKIVFFPLYFLRMLIVVYLGFRYGVKNSDGYILLSPYFKKDLLEFLGFKKYENKIFSMTNPHEFLTDGYKKYQKEKIVLFVGRINYHDKNIPALLDIWKRIEKQNAEYTLCFVGDGTDRKRLEKDIERLGLKHVRLEGMQKNVADYYKKASFLFLTSKEGWGLVLVEAMEYGCIPFAFDSYSSAKEIILDKKNGFLLPPKSNDFYADTALAAFGMEDNELESMRITGYEHIKKFNAKTIAEKWESFFDAINTD